MATIPARSPERPRRRSDAPAGPAPPTARDRSRRARFPPCRRARPCSRPTGPTGPGADRRRAPTSLVAARSSRSSSPCCCRRSAWSSASSPGARSRGRRPPWTTRSGSPGARPRSPRSSLGILLTLAEAALAVALFVAVPQGWLPSSDLPATSVQSTIEKTVPLPRARCAAPARCRDDRREHHLRRHRERRPGLAQGHRAHRRTGTTCASTSPGPKSSSQVGRHQRQTRSSPGPWRTISGSSPERSTTAWAPCPGRRSRGRRRRRSRAARRRPIPRSGARSRPGAAVCSTAGAPRARRAGRAPRRCPGSGRRPCASSGARAGGGPPARRQDERDRARRGRLHGAEHRVGHLDGAAPSCAKSRHTSVKWWPSSSCRNVLIGSTASRSRRDSPGEPGVRRVDDQAALTEQPDHLAMVLAGGCAGARRPATSPSRRGLASRKSRRLRDVWACSRAAPLRSRTETRGTGDGRRRPRGAGGRP